MLAFMVGVEDSRTVQMMIRLREIVWASLIFLLLVIAPIIGSSISLASLAWFNVTIIRKKKSENLQSSDHYSPRQTRIFERIIHSFTPIFITTIRFVCSPFWSLFYLQLKFEEEKNTTISTMILRILLLLPLPLALSFTSRIQPIPTPTPRRSNTIKADQVQYANSEKSFLFQSSYDHSSINNRHASSDWLYNLKTLPNSTVLRQIKNPVITLALWATFISVLQKALLWSGKANMSASMCIPHSAHSFMVSSLGLLLVFRTNSAYQRFLVSTTIPIPGNDSILGSSTFCLDDSHHSFLSILM
jgi:hypothetical protein